MYVHFHLAGFQLGCLGLNTISRDLDSSARFFVIVDFVGDAFSSCSKFLHVQSFFMLKIAQVDIGGEIPRCWFGVSSFHIFSRLQPHPPPSNESYRFSLSIVPLHCLLRRKSLFRQA